MGIVSNLKQLLLHPISRQVKQQRLTYLSHSKLRSLQRCINAIDKDHVEGDVHEFGIALGGCAIILASQLPDRRFHGYDVFGQIPAPSDKDGEDTHQRFDVIASGQARGIEGDAYYGYIDNLYDEVKNSFSAYGLAVDGDRIALHRGLFEDTLRLRHEDKIALAHIDCDWYEPVRFCLDTTAPHISCGGYIIIDDYNDYEGCRKASDDFLTSHPEFEIVRLKPHAVIRRR